jgi:hypothetical protein
MMTIEEQYMKSTIDMAHKAGFKEHNGLIYVTTINDDCAKELKAFEALVRADEREACAKVCDDWPNGRDDVYSIGVAIRERSANERARRNT